MSTASVEPLPHVTFADYLALDKVADVRHEWAAGRVYAMSGGSERHGLLSGLLSSALADGARTAGCRPFQQGRRLRAGLVSYYPDVMVVGPAGDDQFETDASLMIEVLSPSTRDVDRREKATSYATLASLRQYVLVDPDRARFEVADLTADGLRWTAHGPGSVVFTAYGDLHVDAL
ncbi:MAG: Uma2 family endonuclease, partial [Frankiales bacterium]|nr:Uma2 family endonuclease [Frankiales bacterium]